jgi:hypothetical protein
VRRGLRPAFGLNLILLPESWDEEKRAGSRPNEFQTMLKVASLSSERSRRRGLGRGGALQNMKSAGLSDQKPISLALSPCCAAGRGKRCAPGVASCVWIKPDSAARVLGRRDARRFQAKRIPNDAQGCLPLFRAQPEERVGERRRSAKNEACWFERSEAPLPGPLPALRCGERETISGAGTIRWPLPFLHFLRPGVLQRDRAVQDELAGRAVLIEREVGEALELVA